MDEPDEFEHRSRIADHDSRQDHWTDFCRYGTPRFFKAEVMAQAQELLEAEEAERHPRVVIVVDEAHLLSPAQLEELRACG